MKLSKSLKHANVCRFVFAFVVLFFLASETFSQTTEAVGSPITAVCLTKGGQLISGSDNGLQIHELETLRPIRQIVSEIEKLYSIVASPDGSKIAVAGGTPSELGVVEIFSIPKMQLLNRFARFDDIATDVAWLDENKLVAASVTGNCCVFDLRRNLKEKLPQPFNVHSKPILSIEVLVSKEIITAGKDSSIRVWKTDSPAEARVLNNHIDIVNSTSIRPAPNGQVHEMIASASNDATIRFWQPSIGRMVRFTRLESNATSVIWNRDGTIAIVGCEDGSIVLIDPANAKQVAAFKTGGWIYDMVLAGDANASDVVASASDVVASDDSIFVASEKGLSRVRLSK